MIRSEDVNNSVEIFEVITRSTLDWTDEDIECSKRDVSLSIRCGNTTRASSGVYHQPLLRFLYSLSVMLPHGPGLTPLALSKVTYFSTSLRCVDLSYTADGIIQRCMPDCSYLQTIWPAPYSRSYQQPGSNGNITVILLYIH